MGDEDDLITIVDVTDPDDPSFADVKTRRRPLTDAELATLKPMLEKVGSYKFFSMEFNFADGPAVKQFIESVELEEFKRTKQRKIVQDSMKGTVAGREVVLDSNLIEKAFGLVDDGENISKPKGETNGLHAFYIKPKYVHLCQNYRGVYLKLFKSEYAYFVNMAHQIQAYCCGSHAERQITLTQYRAIDLMIRGKPVNWNRYLLQNFQDKLRKYKAGPCPLYFGGTLTALIYKALHVDYSLVNKPLLISPQTPERITGAATDDDRGKKKDASGAAKSKDQQRKDSGPPKKREAVRRQVGAMTRAQRMLTGETLIDDDEQPTTTVSKHQDKKRKRIKQQQQQQRAKLAAKKQKTAAAAAAAAAREQSPPYTPATTLSPYTTGGEEEPVSSGPFELKRRFPDSGKSSDRGMIVATATDRMSRLYAQASGTPREVEMAEEAEALALTASKDLWSKYDAVSSLQQEYQLEHIVSKQMLEQSLQRVQELEDALKERDRKLAELESSKRALQEKLAAAAGEEAAEEAEGNHLSYADEDATAQGPLKVRLKVGQKKASAENSGDEEAAADAAAAAAATEVSKGDGDKGKDNEVASEEVEAAKDMECDQEETTVKEAAEAAAPVVAAELDTERLKAIEEQVAAVAKEQEDKGTDKDTQP